MTWLNLTMILEIIGDGINIDNANSLVEQLEGKTIIEQLGTYYIEDLKDEYMKEYGKDYGEEYASILSEINKRTKRVITYTVKIK